MLAAAGGLLSVLSQGAVNGNSFQMTPESYVKYLELAGPTKETCGIVSGVLRHPNGTIDTVVELVKSSGVNPSAATNWPMLAAAIAIRSAIHRAWRCSSLHRCEARYGAPGHSERSAWKHPGDHLHVGQSLWLF